MLRFPESVQVIDSHTEGEPTRVVLEGWPAGSGETMLERRESLRRDHDHLRRAVICEPRGHDAMVGAVLTPPVTTTSVAGVIFFNNIGYLGMCGHGLIGVVKTLEEMGRLRSGDVQLDTPVGTVGASLESDGSVTIRNVPARCHSLDVAIEVPDLGTVKGDVAWGGNWFFLTSLPNLRLELGNVSQLLAATQSIRSVLDQEDLLAGEGQIDHVELFGPPSSPSADSCNFVLCPGGEYDRSPCGTGCSARMAVLHARGHMQVGDRFIGYSIIGSRFDCTILDCTGIDNVAAIIPTIRGRGWITGTHQLMYDPEDPWPFGYRLTDTWPKRAN